MARLGLLELAALLTVVLVWRTARSQAAKLTYLAVVLISAGSMIASEVLADRGQPEWARALLLTSICVKLAAVPLFFWLLKLADEVPALVLGVIIAVVDMAAFGEFCLSRASLPGCAHAAGAAGSTLPRGTSLLAALLMLTQRSLKRLLVLSTAEDVGFLLLGAASMSVIGTQGALIAASTHALAKALLFICLAAPEAAAHSKPSPSLSPRATRSAPSDSSSACWPCSACRRRSASSAAGGSTPRRLHIGLWPLVLLILSSIFALIAYALALARNWWGPPPDECLRPRRATRAPNQPRASRSRSRPRSSCWP